MSLWGAILGHGNLIYHAAGWQEGGLTASFEKLVLDVEMLQLMIEFLKPIVVDEAELGFEAIAGVPTGGHFFGEPHTMDALRARVLPAAGVELAKSRELAAGGRPGRDPARHRGLEARALRSTRSPSSIPDPRGARCLCREAAPGNRRRRAVNTRLSNSDS